MRTERSLPTSSPISAPAREGARGAAVKGDWTRALLFAAPRPPLPPARPGALGRRPGGGRGASGAASREAPGAGGRASLGGEALKKQEPCRFSRNTSALFKEQQFQL